MKTLKNISHLLPLCIIAILSLFLNTGIDAQGVGINSSGQSPYPGAILDIKSNDKGVLLPRTDTNSIINPVEGMIIYDTMGSVFRYYSGQQWLMMLQEGYNSFWWADMDGDGFGYPFNVIYAPTPPEHYVGNNDDCDDTNPNLHPGMAEVCDGLDNDCDGQADEDIYPPECYICSGMLGIVLSYDYCVINDVCYPAGTASPDSPCLVCDPSQSQSTWSSICSNNEACCFGQCIDILTDLNNCGDCGIVCNDGNPCTTDFCINGVCFYVSETEGSPCPDGFCDGNGQCISACEFGCDDGNPCTTDFCVNDICYHTNASAGTACPEGYCDGNGQCISGCENGCDDGNPCTTDSCVNGNCQHIFAPAGTVCPGGFCNGNGQCIQN